VHQPTELLAIVLIALFIGAASFPKPNRHDLLALLLGAGWGSSIAAAIFESPWFLLGLVAILPLFIWRSSVLRRRASLVQSQQTTIVPES